MTPRKRLVLDTNLLISRLLLPDSVPGRAVRKAIAEAVILVSDATMAELADVLARAKFDPYVSIADRQEFIRLFGRVAEWVVVNHRLRACRDPRDDKVLEVAVNGAADAIVTDDADLRALAPFRGVAIVTPAQYLGS